MVVPGFPQFQIPDAPERRIEITSEDAWILLGVRPAGPDEPALVCQKIYFRGHASLAERLALLTAGRRVCSW